jgi:hypothetical protein
MMLEAKSVEGKSTVEIMRPLLSESRIFVGFQALLAAGSTAKAAYIALADHPGVKKFSGTVTERTAAEEGQRSRALIGVSKLYVATTTNSTFPLESPCWIDGLDSIELTSSSRDG